MKVLIAIKSCHKYPERRQAQRATWIPNAQGIDVRFFLGLPSRPAAVASDEIVLNCRDDYQHMTEKLREICRWAKASGYDAALIGDDDAYIRPERLLASDFADWHYAGRVRPSLHSRYIQPFCSGIGYTLSAEAISMLASVELGGDHCDDRWAGQVLAAAGIEPHPDYRYGVAASRRNMQSLSEGPRAGNDLICVGEYKNLESMTRIHKEFREQASYTGKLQLSIAQFFAKYDLQSHHQSGQWRGTRARLQTA